MNEIEHLIIKLERDGVPFARNFINDIITHFDMLKIKVTKLSLIRVLTKCSDDLLIRYENNDRQVYYDMYDLIVDVFKIESSNHFYTD